MYNGFKKKWIIGERIVYLLFLLLYFNNETR